MIRELFAAEKRYLDYFFDHIDEVKAETILQQLLHVQGTIFFTGIGKSGKIAEKIVQTMISTGTRAMYLEAVGALHGDIGILQAGDLVVFLTKSGDSHELIDLAIAVKRKAAVKTVAWVSNPEGRILPFVDQSIILPLEGEICPFNLAPTTSCAVQLIFGDIMAMAMMKAKTFSLSEYALNHPAGAIGQRIAVKARDLMLEGEELPLCLPTDDLCDVLVILSDKRCGCLLIVDETMRLLGIFTDGDLRRAIQSNRDQVFGQTMGELMTTSYLYAYPETSARDLLKMMQRKVMMLPIVEEGILKGLVHMHDLVGPFQKGRKQPILK